MHPLSVCDHFSIGVYVIDIVEDVTKSNVEEEMRRGRIINYTQVSSNSFKVLTFDMVKKASKKV